MASGWVRLYDSAFAVLGRIYGTGAVEYVVGAFMSVMTWWLDEGAKLPPQKIDAMFRRMVADGVPPSIARSKSIGSSRSS